ncbi:hypothetical protein SAMN04515674_115106 [Pseudarcicella hirudinis]|uniref:DUF456 domain-containing protein n=1 Tax=Pseudarcicella hirudinis TaxID=1079859 RepID=A0A1I5XPX1_9BACT|nr:DUF456 domain-containing protein [Pseudarcicella hirudinis]SFQ33999.1 hypothetical protein SAMN04515674_115106 [Pseudarcicella hirudinis]
MQDILLLILSIICLLAGLAGAILPIPGPPLSYAGLICLHYTKYAEFQKRTLIIFGLITAAVWIFDHYAPIWGTKKFGGTKAGIWGSGIGLIAGLFVIPGVGMFLGAFLGAFIGEIIVGSDWQKSLKSAIGSFIGLITGIIAKIVLCLAMIVLAGMALSEYFFIMF